MSPDPLHAARWPARHARHARHAPPLPARDSRRSGPALLRASPWQALRSLPARLQRMVSLLSLLSLLTVALGLLMPGRAQAGAVPGELPALVGRLSSLQGDVQWYDRDNATWLGNQPQPLRNWPLATGDRLRTGRDARAELRVGSTTLRLGADVDLVLEQLDEQRLALRLQSGTVALRLAKPTAGSVAQVEVATPEGRWLPLSPGHYRLERQPEARTPATQATVWRGELRFEGPDSSLVIPAGRRADVWQTWDRGPTRFAWAPVERDAFADWVARDERFDDAPITARHVPSGMSGWQDLDRHGDWVDSPEHGSVWQPRVVAPGWAPFHDGRWAWVSPWGWTWIDAAPWGFAPFHYGSWVVFGGRWCWSPGPRQVRPRYAPVHSAWVSGPQISVGIQIGGGYRPPPPRVVLPVAPPRPVVVVMPPPPLPHDRRPPLVGPLPQPRPGEWPDHRRGDERRDDRHDGRRGGDHDAQRPDADRHRPGAQPGPEAGGRRPPFERGERGERGGRGESDERGRREPQAGRNLQGPATVPVPVPVPVPDLGPARPDRQHGAERVTRSPAPLVVANPAGTPVLAPAPMAATAPKSVPTPPPAPPAPPAPLAAAPVKSPAARTEAPRADPPPPRADSGQRTERANQPERAQPADRPGRQDRPERPDRPDRPDRPERAERPDRTDGAVRQHRQDAVAWR